MPADETGDSSTGDGDPSTGDGDGDPSTGDGDGDPSTGDGDGDPSTGDGDGDPCPAGTLGCACLDGQVCDGNLECVADVCEEPAPGVCGDAVLNLGEECDDGPANGPGNACKADCTLNVCGDGELGPGEACDDGNLDDGDGCEASCAWTPCAFIWEQTFEDPGHPRIGRRLATDSNDNIALTVTYHPGQLDSRLQVYKLDPDGALLWTAEAIDLRMTGYGLAVGLDDAIYGIGPEFEGAFSRDLTRRFEPDGTLGWYTQQVVPQPGHGYGVAVAPDGAVIIAGYQQLQSALNKAFVARLNPDTGAVVWTQLGYAPGSDITAHYAVTVAADGSIYATGGARIDLDMQILIQKFDADGQLIWMTHVDDYGSAWGLDIEAAPDGGVAVAGEFLYGDGSGSDLWVGRFDANGNPLWSDLYTSGPGLTYDEGSGVAVGPEGHVHVVGTIDPDLYRGVYRKYDAEGALLCSLVLDPEGMGIAHLLDVAIDSDGFPVITGDKYPSLYVAKLTP